MHVIHREDRWLLWERDTEERAATQERHRDDRWFIRERDRNVRLPT